MTVAVDGDSRLFDRPKFRLAGDRGLLVEFGDAIAPEINQRVRAMTLALEAASAGWNQGSDPHLPLGGGGLRSPDHKPFPARVGRIASVCDGLAGVEAPSAPWKPSFRSAMGGNTARTSSLSPSITGSGSTMSSASTRQPRYPIYMLGFSPGFPFLGGLSEKLHTPRLASPRTRVPAGSVGIANNQTGIYPIASPGAGSSSVGRPCGFSTPKDGTPFF